MVQITNGENTVKFLKLAEEFGGDVGEQVSPIVACNSISDPLLHLVVFRTIACVVDVV